MDNPDHRYVQAYYNGGLTSFEVIRVELIEIGSNPSNPKSLRGQSRGGYFRWAIWRQPKSPEERGLIISIVGTGEYEYFYDLATKKV